MQTRRCAKTPTCLIVEDSEFDQQRMTRIVLRSQQNLQIQIAKTIQVARDTLQGGGITLILLDNNLPDGIGANFALELAADEKLSRIPIVMVSDWPSPFMWEKAASAGVLFIVRKSDFGARYIREALRVAPPCRRVS